MVKGNDFDVKQYYSAKLFPNNLIKLNFKHSSNFYSQNKKSAMYCKQQLASFMRYLKPKTNTKADYITG